MGMVNMDAIFDADVTESLLRATPQERIIAFQAINAFRKRQKIAEEKDKLLATIQELRALGVEVTVDYQLDGDTTVTLIDDQTGEVLTELYC